MAQTGRVQTHILTAFEFILAAVFIAAGGSMYQYCLPASRYIGKACLTALAVSVIIIFFLKKPYRDRRTFVRGIIIAAVICLYLLIFLIIKPVNVKSYIFMLCQVAALSVYVFICCGNDRSPGAVRRYSQLVTVLAAISLICWFLFSIIKITPSSGTVESSWYSSYFTKPVITYFNIYFEPQKINFFGHQIIRNCAIFTEAPMFTWHLLAALFIELFINRRLSVVRIVIICAAIISTISTMGYIFGLGAVLIRIIIAVLQSGRYRALKKGTKAAIWIIAAVIFAAAAVVSLMLLKEKLLTYSGDTRMEDFRAGFLGWMDNFWTGAGFGNRETIFIHRTVYSDYGFSNGIMEVAAEGGLYLLICFVGPFIFGFIDAVRRKDAGLAVFACLFFVMASITSSQYTYLMYFIQLFMLFGLMQTGKNGSLNCPGTKLYSTEKDNIGE